MNCYIVSVSWGINKNFQKVFKRRSSAEEFFLYVKKEIENNYPNETLFLDTAHNKDWYVSPVKYDKVFCSLRTQEFISSTLAIDEYNRYMNKEMEE